MGKLNGFGIELQNKHAVYAPGDTIVGEVIIDLKENKNDIGAISISCCGTAHTEWSESHGTGEHRRTVYYTWSIPYFQLHSLLRGTDDNNGASTKITLPAGKHALPFVFKLPTTNLPPPIEAGWGWVRYQLSAVINRSWKFDHHVTRYFSIRTEKDLRKLPGALKWQEASINKTVCCLCCASGPIRLDGSINKTGFVPGENIFVSIKVQNDSSRRILGVRMKLIQICVCLAQGGGMTVHRRIMERTLTEKKMHGCDPMDCQLYESRAIRIPPVPPNNFESCPCIDVTYHVKIEAGVSFSPSNPELLFPIIIGTIPVFPPKLLAREPSTAPPGRDVKEETHRSLSKTHGLLPKQREIFRASRSSTKVHPGIPQKVTPGAGQLIAAIPPAPLPSNCTTKIPAQLQAPLPVNLSTPSPAKIPAQIPANQPAPLPANHPAESPTHLQAHIPVSLPTSLQPMHDGIIYQPGDVQSGILPHVHDEYLPVSITDGELPPPPMYELAVCGLQKMATEEGQFGTGIFAPRYPFYNFEDAVGQEQTNAQQQEPITAQPRSSF